MKTILVTRAQMEKCSRALPKKVYECPQCGANYAHDDGYKHWALTCPKRNAPVSV